MNRTRYEATKSKIKEAKRIASMPLIDYITAGLMKKANAKDVELDTEYIPPTQKRIAISFEKCI